MVIKYVIIKVLIYSRNKGILSKACQRAPSALRDVHSLTPSDPGGSSGP